MTIKKENVRSLIPSMKVLIISSNSLPAAPIGPAYLAGAVRQAGHQVQIFDCLHASDLEHDLPGILQAYQPDVIGVSIRFVFDDEIDLTAPLGTRHTDLRPGVKRVTELVRHNTDAPIVLGGSGFNYYAQDWLEYLDLRFGIRGEGEVSFPLFLKQMAEGDNNISVPGLVLRKNDSFEFVPPIPVQDLDNQALPAYDLVDWQRYAERKINPAILTKRGCAFFCTYCPYSKLEGKRYRLKSPSRILAEVHNTLRNTHTDQAMMCENNFNAPRQHAEDICKAFIAQKSAFQWGTGDLRPVGITDKFCRLMEASGCFYVNLSIESASETMLRSTKRGYTVQQVRKSLEALSRSNIPFSVSLMFGAPGETPQTIAETLSLVDDYHVPNGVWVTIGIYLWTDYQEIVSEALKSGILKDKKELFRGAVYLAPGLSRSYLRELPELIHTRRGYVVQFNKPDESWMP